MTRDVVSAAARGRADALSSGDPDMLRRWRLVNPQVTVVGDAAVVVGAVRDVVERDGEPLPFAMRFTQTWIRSACPACPWKAFEAATEAPPAGAAVPPAVTRPRRRSASVVW